MELVFFHGSGRPGFHIVGLASRSLWGEVVFFGPLGFGIWGILVSGLRRDVFGGFWLVVGLAEIWGFGSQNF